MAVGVACSGTFETCEQHSTGAFGPNGGNNKTITVIGAPEVGLLSGPAPGTLVALFSVPPLPGVFVNGVMSVPGPGVVSLPGTGALCSTAAACP
jgi:hypothetical protein